MKQLLVSNIERLLQENNWSKADLAKAMGVDPASLSRTLSSDLRLSTIEKIASAFDVSVKTLFDDTDRIEGFAFVHGKLVHFNSCDEFTEAINKVKIDERPKFKFTGKVLHNKTKFIKLDASKCVACWKCVQVCNQGVLGKVDLPFHKHMHVDKADACIGCLKCIKECPQEAISKISK